MSTAAGGPYTPKFEALFEKAGMSLEDSLNKIRVPGHRGPHPAYNQAVYERLRSAVKGLEGEAYRKALETELSAIAKESRTAGTALNKLLQKE